MTGAFIILGITLLTGLILYLTRGKQDTETTDTAAGTPTPQEEEEETEVCCGRHAVCEKGLLTAEELYYNDEELDRYKGREPGSYTSEEIEEFREVLYTLRPEEVYQWGVALTQRDIPLPDALRDEWLMLC
ncbi:MAG: hypothetical protein K2I24_03470 [Duncaniella sp.]|nr:hypothetical protein [Duncaniella sp.]MDE5693961.1 hypothetical protein [Duncaniella sp.]